MNEGKDRGIAIERKNDMREQEKHQTHTHTHSGAMPKNAYNGCHMGHMPLVKCIAMYYAKGEMNGKCCVRGICTLRSFG